MNNLHASQQHGSIYPCLTKIDIISAVFTPLALSELNCRLDLYNRKTVFVELMESLHQWGKDLSCIPIAIFIFQKF